jgi:hypothetical protein
MIDLARRRLYLPAMAPPRTAWTLVNDRPDMPY